MRKFLLILGLGAALLSCEQRPVVTFVPVPMVTSLLADTTVSAWSPLAAYDAEDSRGSIAVIGEPDRVSWMMGTLLLQDSFDNIDGRLLSDGLPDSPESLRFVFFHHQFPGVQPYGGDAFGLQFGAEDGGGENFAEGHLLRHRRPAQLGEKGIHLLLHLLPLRASEKARHDVPVAFFHIGQAFLAGP